MTEGITANIFPYDNSLAADAAQSGQERITDEMVDNCLDGELAYTCIPTTATKSSCPSFRRLPTNSCRCGSPGKARFTMSRLGRCCAMPSRTHAPSALLTLILRRNRGDFSPTFSGESFSAICRMTFVNIQSSARRLIAAEAIQTCQNCAVDKTDIGATPLILRS